MAKSLKRSSASNSIKRLPSENFEELNLHQLFPIDFSLCFQLQKSCLSLLRQSRQKMVYPAIKIVSLHSLYINWSDAGIPGLFARFQLHLAHVCIRSCYFLNFIPGILLHASDGATSGRLVAKIIIFVPTKRRSNKPTAILPQEIPKIKLFCK